MDERDERQDQDPSTAAGTTRGGGEPERSNISTGGTRVTYLLNDPPPKSSQRVAPVETFDLMTPAPSNQGARSRNCSSFDDPRSFGTPSFEARRAPAAEEEATETIFEFLKTPPGGSRTASKDSTISAKKDHSGANVSFGVEQGGGNVSAKTNPPTSSADGKANLNLNHEPEHATEASKPEAQPPTSASSSSSSSMSRYHLPQLPPPVLTSGDWGGVSELLHVSSDCVVDEDVSREVGAFAGGGDAVGGTTVSLKRDPDPPNINNRMAATTSAAAKEAERMFEESDSVMEEAILKNQELLNSVSRSIEVSASASQVELDEDLSAVLTSFDLSKSGLVAPLSGPGVGPSVEVPDARADSSSSASSSLPQKQRRLMADAAARSTSASSSASCADFFGQAQVAHPPAFEAEIAASGGKNREPYGGAPPPAAPAGSASASAATSARSTRAASAGAPRTKFFVRNDIYGPAFRFRQADATADGENGKRVDRAKNTARTRPEIDGSAEGGKSPLFFYKTSGSSFAAGDPKHQHQRAEDDSSTTQVGGHSHSHGRYAPAAEGCRAGTIGPQFGGAAARTRTSKPSPAKKSHTYHRVNDFIMSGGGIGKSFLFMNDDPKSNGNGSPRTNLVGADLERTLSSFRTADRYQPYSAGPSTPAPARSGTSRSGHIFIRPTGSGSSALPRTMTKTIASANLFDPSAPDSSSSFVATRSNSKIYQRIRSIEHEYSKGYSPIHNNRSPTTHYPRSLASLNFIGGRRQHLSPTRFSTTAGGNPSPRGPAGMHADIELAHQFHQRTGGAGSTSPSRARSPHLNKLYLHSSSLTAGSEYLGIPTSSLTSEFASPRKRDWAKEGVGRAVGGVSARTRIKAAVQYHDKSGIIYGQDARAGRHEKVDYAELARNLINEERRSVPRKKHGAEESRVRSAGRLWREFARSAGVIMTNYTGRADHDHTQHVDVEPYGGPSRSDGNVLAMSDNEFDVPMCSFSSPARQPQSNNYYHYVPEDRAGRSGASAVRLTSQPISSSSRYPYNTLTGDTSIMNNSTVSSHSQRQPLRRPTVERYRTPFARYLRSRSRTPMKNVQGAYGGGVGEDFFRAGGEDVGACASAPSSTARVEADTPPVDNVSYHSSSARIIQDFLAQTRNNFRGDRAAGPASTHARGRAPAPHPLLQGQSQGSLQVQYQLQEPQQQEPAPAPPSFQDRLSEMRRSHLEGLERILSPEKRRVLSTSGRIIYPAQNRYRQEGAGMERSSDAASVIGTSSPSRLQYSRSHAFDTALQTMSIPSKRTTSAARHLVSPSPTSPKKPDVSTYFLEAALRSYI